MRFVSIGRFAFVAFVTLVGARAASASDPVGGFRMPPSAVIIEGERVAVAWNDGDSFGFMEGKYVRQRVRLMGFNALESYGPLHAWGKWTPMELYKVTKAATRFARTRVWNCAWEGKKDHYGRMLVYCRDLVEAMVSEGYGHVYALEPPVDEGLVGLQHEAMAARRGMWAKGVPEGLVTSLHSVSEAGGGKGKTYDRVISPKTGLSKAYQHENAYGLCQKVCHEGSCMIYVPFEKRYGLERADCVRTKGLW
ncbi:thermonuclease family protein [Myxococcota bacterium]|nr:thermonuclease family protein [Myxococcota bacterium]